MTGQKRWVACQSCKALGFCVYETEEDGCVVVVCGNCNAELLTAPVALPKQRVAVMPV